MGREVPARIRWIIGQRVNCSRGIAFSIDHGGRLKLSRPPFLRGVRDHGRAG